MCNTTNQDKHDRDMKPIYSNKYLTWLLILIIVFYVVMLGIKLTDNVSPLSRLFAGFLILVSVAALLAMLFKSKHAKLSAQLFIAIVLILPPSLVIYRYLIDLLFYGINRVELLAYPILVQLITGATLLILSFTKTKNT